LNTTLSLYPYQEFGINPYSINLLTHLKKSGFFIW
jgi:hypothetical protein